VAIRPPAAPAVPLTFRLAVRDIGGITRRNLLRVIRTPQLLFMSIVQPTIILLLFRYVLGGAIRVPGLDYVDYVVPGIFLEAVLIGGMTTALALAQDLQAGIVDRFRSLPMARPAFLAGRTLAGICRSVLALACIIGLGRLPRPVAGGPVVRRDLCRLPGHLAQPLPQGHRLTRKARPRLRSRSSRPKTVSLIRRSAWSRSPAAASACSRTAG
jgi:hypothetical protein